MIHELRVTYRVVARDLTASMIPATLFSLAALHTTGRFDPVGIVDLLARCGLYFFLYIYAFCLCNQIHGYEEDRINKPDRVLPAGLISLHGARARWWIAMGLFPAVGFALGGWSMMGWALLWQATIVAYNQLGLHRHWFTKNFVFISVGSVALLGPAWALATPLTDVAWRWILFVSIAFGVTLNVQDLRDVEGDRLSGRCTLPMALGDRAARVAIALGIGLLPVATHLVLVRGTRLGWAALTIEAVLAALNLIVALRALRLRTPRADHKTYTLHTYWFCAVLASALVLLANPSPQVGATVASAALCSPNGTECLRDPRAARWNVRASDLGSACCR